MTKDVDVIITRETAALTQVGFGMPFILATNADKAYKEYTDLPSVAVDYAESTEAYKFANRVFGQSPRPPILAIAGKQSSVPAELVTFLNQLVETNNNWYFLLCDLQTDAAITALSTWTDAQKKLYFATTSTLGLAATLESERTVLMYHESDSTAAAGWVGKCAPENPGSITWKFKTINGLVAADIGVTELNQLHEDGGNSYIRKLGVLQTSEGKTTSGEYIDVMRSQDFIEARMIEQVSRTLFTKKKVPYDNTGIAMLVADVETVLKLATSQGIVALDDDGNGMWEVTAIRREDTPVNDIALRKYNGISWVVTLAGAVHEVTIRGTLKY
jgi:hypothetical protein